MVMQFEDLYEQQRKKWQRKRKMIEQLEKEQFGEFLKRQKERDKIQKKTHCQSCGECLQGFDTCDQCGRINK